MSSCLSSRACGFDVEHMLKWPCTIMSSRTTSNSSSPSSTLSESSNSPIGISTRKPRTPRKRPNQTYNEAAALLSMACPNIFSTKYLTKRTTNLPNITRLHLNEEPELIWSFQAVENSGFLLGPRVIEKPGLVTGPKVVSLSPNAGEGETDPSCVCVDLSDECLDDFDTESLLDEEIELGIDSIMGDSKLNEENNELGNNIAYDYNTCYGYPVGLGFGLVNGVRALRKGGERSWCSVPLVNVVNLSTSVVMTKGEKSAVGKKMKKKKVENLMKLEKGNVKPENGHGLGLKLNYDDVLNAWSDKELPMPEELSQSSSSGVDINARAAKIDLFSENGGWSESGATGRCMDKKKIRHQVKNAVPDKRPRCKGRFVKKTNHAACNEET
uniref:protein CHLOROPLAST IMPORT APPARATUS 2-like n=1 Tax=Erigeron canadensis TaxID=72917 RepID=UPI001CB92310|nr:protein CHLOROPLAST IMPORT APPARATUS 2-like [Erigeron canadensis]